MHLPKLWSDPNTIVQSPCCPRKQNTPNDNTMICPHIKFVFSSDKSFILTSKYAEADAGSITVVFLAIHRVPEDLSSHQRSYKFKKFVC